MECKLCNFDLFVSVTDMDRAKFRMRTSSSSLLRSVEQINRRLMHWKHFKLTERGMNGLLFYGCEFEFTEAKWRVLIKGLLCFQSSSTQCFVSMLLVLKKMRLKQSLHTSKGIFPCRSLSYPSATRYRLFYNMKVKKEN